jgi:hypothetical protein
MWYSNADGKKEWTLYLKNREFFADLELYGLTDGTIAYILGIKEFQVWKWRTGQSRIPPKYRGKLKKFSQRMKKSSLSQW